MEFEAGTSSNNDCTSKKRKLDDTTDSSPNDRKLQKLDVSLLDASTSPQKEDISSENSTSYGDNTTENYICTIDSLPDCVFLELFLFLKSSDLYHLSLCNRRFNSLCRDKTLWYRVHAICDGQSPPHINMRSYFNDSTAYVQLSKATNSCTCDPTNEDLCFTPNFISSLKCLPILKTFILENHSLNVKTLDLTCLPESVTELRLKGTSMLGQSEVEPGVGVFQNIVTALPNLEIVDVSFCQWFLAQFLVSLSKCHKLKTLILMGCRNLKDIVPYASLAAVWGFKALETLDIRQTHVGDSEIGCYSKIKSLKHILLERPNDEVNEENADESITDICTTNLGMRNWHPSFAVNANVYIFPVPIEGGDFVEDTLETLVVRNYPRITNITLKHAEKCLKSLKYLDVTGTSCSAEQIAIFKHRRPEVKLLHDSIIVA